MKILYTVEEGGVWTPLEIKVPDGEIFAICLPDGTIWDYVIGVDTIHKIKKTVFEKLYSGESSYDNSRFNSSSI